MPGETKRPGIRPLSAFDDNYIWLLDAGAGGQAVVDPGDEDPVLEHLQAEGGRLDAILITHRHGDHTGGIAGLLAAFPGIPVYAPRHEAVRGATHPVGEGDLVRLGESGASLRVLEVPGHTEGHIAYLGDGVLFSGDTLFSGGCGRVFGGTHEQLYRSLRRIAGLPADTLVYCAHEYTLANLGFARWVEPENPALARRIAAAEAARERGEPTVPSSLALELETNPFLRTDQPAVIAAAERYRGKRLTSGEAVFIAIREWKDREYD